MFRFIQCVTSKTFDFDIEHACRIDHSVFRFFFHNKVNDKTVCCDNKFAFEQGNKRNVLLSDRVSSKAPYLTI